ncbi:hypothetical protein [Streptomyces sp. UH6]|uniref:hypothetical protein n=1 Tax=Streptomyces sp. UH6 TaxID=2748379 RepID=UPI0015D4A864|nr:hypothetical protein [Streptomyces sp. UH6]
MKLAPILSKAASLTRTQITAAFKRAGRERGIEAGAERLRKVFRTEWARQPKLVEDALGKQTLAHTRTAHGHLHHRRRPRPGCRGGVRQRA